MKKYNVLFIETYHRKILISVKAKDKDEAFDKALPVAKNTDPIEAENLLFINMELSHSDDAIEEV